MGDGSVSFTPQLGTACQIKSAKAHALSCCTVVGCCLPACLQIWEPQLAAFEVQIVTAAA
jgi:hypothetical protein